MFWGHSKNNKRHLKECESKINQNFGQENIKKALHELKTYMFGERKPISSTFCFKKEKIVINHKEVSQTNIFLINLFSIKLLQSKGPIGDFEFL